jgi:biopolymer transport protein ExbD
MRSWPEKRERRARIEIIPMIDVMMFLLVFFVLISINVLPALGLKVVLPRAKEPDKITDIRKVTLLIGRDGQVLMDGTRVAVDDLPARLKAMEGPHVKLAVIIASDKGAVVQMLVDVLDALKAADIPAASIISKAK